MSVLIFILIISTWTGCDGALQFAKSYSDHMVLQRSPHRAVIWGHAAKNNDKVTVQIQGHGTPVTTVTANHMWKVKLPVMSDEGPFTITASSSEGTISLKDVLFGDVWVCSGQSNMVFNMQQVNNSAAEIKKALTFKKIRLFQFRHAETDKPLVDLQQVSHLWAAPTSNTVPHFSAVCLLYGEYLFNHRKYPIGLIEADWGGTPIETWSSSDAINACSTPKVKRAHHPDQGLWNSMIHPILATTIYGAIWYQGEANAGHPTKYTCQFPAMIKDWRQKFHHASLGETSLNFPFGFVQLAPSAKDHNKIGGFPNLRWSQTLHVGHVPNPKMTHTFMAIAMDLPDPHSPRGSIHPRFKQDVAERLGLAGLAVAYGEKGISYQGPYPTSFNNKVSGQVTIEYDHGHNVVEIRSNNGFEICCSSSSQANCGANDSWVAAPVLSHHGATVTINTSGCHNNHVVGLRYAWRDSPCEFKKCAVYGRGNDLPGPSFIRNTAF